MDRNREARRASMVASTNGLSRRRHRPNSLRDSPDEDGPVEFSESLRLRERVKKDRDRDRDRERDRERERERSSRSKRRRGERLMHGSDRGDDSSQESNDDEDDEDDDNNHHHHSNGGGGGVRLLPPNPSVAATSFPNHHNHSSGTNSHLHHQNHHLQHRKTFPPSSTNVIRAAPVWKSGDEMIGVSVPRKARSAHTKRSHDWISSTSGSAVNGGGVGGEQNHRQASTSPVRQSLVSTPAPSPAPPLSPSSSNASGRKKIKANGSKQRPPKTSSKSTSSNPEELEIEIAEVLYGLMTQSQAPSKKEIASNDSREVNNRSSGDAKSRVSSPVSNSPSPAILPTNSNSSTAPFSTIAPKRKRPRQVSENQSSASVRSSPSSATAKAEIDQTITMKAEVSSPNLEKTPVENGGSLYALTSSINSQGLTVSSDPVPESMKVDSETKPVADELRYGESRDVVGKEEVSSPKKESAAVAAEDSNREDSTAMAPATTANPLAVSEVENHREEKIQIDLMAPPPQLRSSPEGEGEVNFGSTVVDHKAVVSDSIYQEMKLEGGKLGKVEGQTVEAEEKKVRTVVETESKRRIEGKGRDIDLQLDLEKLERDSGCANNKSQQLSQKQQQQPPPLVKMNKEEQNTEKASQSSSLPLPMSMTSWSGGLPPMGYMAPLQGVITMDGGTIPSTPLQPIFSQPRPKRCATHCYIAKNIHLLQQFMKMNPFWPPTASSASLFGSKACNLNVVPATEFNGNIAARGVNAGPDKGQGLAIFPGLGGKDKGSQAPNIPDPAQRKQQILQQALPSPVAPNNLLPGHTFIFPLNQQQVATAASRPGATKSPAAAGSLVSSNASNSAAGNASATAGGNPAAVSFTYPNMPPNEPPYLAIVQNNAYSNAYFPIPAVSAPLNYRGAHAQPMPLFSGSFFSPQMIHPPQLQQQQQQPTNSQSKQMQQGQQNTSMSSGSSSSHKHLQNQQKRPQGNAGNGSSGSGNLHNFPASKSHPSQPQQQPQNQHILPPQARHIENELGSEDSPSTAESRGSRPPINVYNQNYVMQIHPSNFGVIAPPATMGVVSAATSSSGNQSEKKSQQPQQQALKTGLESMPPQPFAMSFASISGASAPGIDISSMAQGHAIFQALPEATRQNLQIVAAAAAAQQKKNYREDSRSGSGDPTTADDERKGLAGKVPATSAGVGQSIAFSRSDLTDVSGSKMAANNVIDSSRSLSVASGPAWTARAVTPNSMGTVVSNAQLQVQLQQQMVQQLHKQQQQQHQQQQLATAITRSKAPPTSNGIVYSEHLTSSAPVGAKFPNTISAFPQNLVQTSNNNSPSQSSQWKGSARTSTSQAQSSLASATSSLKNLTQQQLRTQQNHTQISFGANQKSTPPQIQNPPSSNQSHSSAMVAGSPTTSSISKGASGSPRTATSASMSNKTDQTPSLAAQQGKASMSTPNQKLSPVSGRSVPSILGNQHIPSTSSSGSKSQMQQHLPKGAHQSQLFFSSSYAQAQSTSTSSASATSGYYIQRRRPEQQQAQHPPGSTASASSTGMLTLCPVALGGGSTSDPAKAIAAAAAASSNVRGGSLPSQSILHTTQFAAQSSGNQHHMLPTGYPYVHHSVQVKPTEQKQPAGNDNLHACWQPEKK